MPGAEIRDHLANARTLLARLRVGVILLGFGYAVAKFALIEQHPARGLGVAIAAAGWLVTAVAGALFVWQRRMIGAARRVNSAWWELSLSLLTAAAGMAILAYVAAAS